MKSRRRTASDGLLRSVCVGCEADGTAGYGMGARCREHSGSRSRRCIDVTELALEHAVLHHDVDVDGSVKGSEVRKKGVAVRESGN